MYGERPRTPSGDAAKVLILIGLIIEVIEVVVIVLVGLIILIIPIVGLVVFGLAGIGILWLVLVYVFSYSRVSEGDYAGARTPTLVFGILSLLTVNLVSGILYLVAYAELGKAESEAAAFARPGLTAGSYPAWGTAPGAPPYLSSAGGPQKFCSQCGRPNAIGSRFCSACGAALA